MKKFEFIEHTADVKFKAYGKTITESFENSLLAFSEVLSRGEKVESLKKKNIEIKGKDYEELLYNLIEELIYLSDAENFISSNSKLEIIENEEKILKGIIYGDDSGKYSELDHVKAATYAEMHVKNLGDYWECQAVLDV